MADIDIDPFGDNDKPDEHSDETGETIPFTPPIVIKTPSWEPELETSFGRGKTQSTKLSQIIIF